MFDIRSEVFGQCSRPAPFLLQKFDSSEKYKISIFENT